MIRTGRRFRNRMVRAVARRVVRSDDSGATLILALIFITVVSVVIASILSFVDTSMRTTIAVRSEASQTAAADGAAQIAINALRTNTYTGVSGTHCFGASDNQNISGFYTGNDGTQYSATVTCHQDVTDSQPGGAYNGGEPTYSLLTLGTGLGTGINLTRGVFGLGHGFTLDGDVWSNSTISVQPFLTTDGAVSARGNCTGTINASPKTCNAGGSPVGDPSYTAPNGDRTAGTVPNCPRSGSFRVLTLSPGLYTSAGDLNSLTGPLTPRCDSPILKFTPGVYYFDFTGPITTWFVSDGYVVGGTIAPGKVLDQNIGSNMPGMCVSPIPAGSPAGWTPPADGLGVTFIFGGQSKLDVTGGGGVELCGNYSTGSPPPIAIYGLKNDIVDGGTVTVHAGCTGCDVIQTESLISGELIIQGTTYIPNGNVNVAVLRDKGQQFRAGVIARSFSVQALFGSGNDIGPVTELPADPVPWRTVVYLQVFVCTGAGPCPTTGAASNQLKVKVGIVDPTGVAAPAKRQVTVYNWSVQRT